MSKLNDRTDLDDTDEPEDTEDTPEKKHKKHFIFKFGDTYSINKFPRIRILFLKIKYYM